jgi:hypothetical protein
MLIICSLNKGAYFMEQTKKYTFKENFFMVVFIIVVILVVGFLFLSPLYYMAKPIAAQNNSNRLVESISQMRFYKNNIKKELSSIDDFKKTMNLDPLMVKRMRYNRFIIGKKDQTVQGDFVDYSTQKIKISKENIQVYSVETSPDVCNILVEKILSSSCKYEGENKTLFKVEF